MQHLTQWTDLQAIENVHITLVIGNFDGLHRGHMALIQQAKELKEQQKTVLALMNFNPHPSAFFTEKSVPRLTTDDEIKRILTEQGIDYWLQMPFGETIACLEPEEFINLITSHLKIKHIVVGFNFKFGNKASGHCNTLLTLASAYNYQPFIVEPVYLQDSYQEISSTLIREMIRTGQIQHANRALGRHYSVCGEVVYGYHRGHELGFPTANILVVRDKLIPKNGVYAGIVGSNNAAISIGSNPTFGNRQSTVEVHILDFSETIYGQLINVEFTQYLRPEHKFESVTALTEQLKQDIAQITQLNPVNNIYKSNS